MRYAPVKSAGPGLACGIGYKGSPSHATNRRRSLLSRKALAKAWQKDDADTTRVLRCKCCWYGAGKNNNELTNIKTDSDPILALHLRARCGLGSVLLARRRLLLLLPLPRRIPP